MRNVPRLALTLVAAAVITSVGQAQDASPGTAPLPVADRFLAEVRDNLSRADRVQDRYAYKERRTELHVNPFGSKVGTDGVSVYAVTPGGDGVWYRTLIERDGTAVTDSKAERRERRPRNQSTPNRSPLDDVAQVLEFKLERREVVAGRDTIIVAFAPRAGARPQTREGRLASNFKGDIWIDEAAREVTRAQAVAIDDLSFGFGLVARLNAGTTATVTRDPVDAGVWLPTSLRFVGQGRAMLLRKLTIDYAISWFDYRKVP